MTKIALVAGGTPSTVACDFDYYVGVDRGALWLLENELALDMAVGDFDSVSPSELATIKANAGQIHIAPVDKDDTDTELALKIIFAQFPQAQVSLFGVFGGRLDHTLSNIFLPSHPDLAPFMAQLTLCDEQNRLSYLSQGEHTLPPEQRLPYLAFLVEGGGRLEIEGAKYELTAANFFQRKIYTSNEFMTKSVRVRLDKGYVIVIESKDRR